MEVVQESQEVLSPVLCAIQRKKGFQLLSVFFLNFPPLFISLSARELRKERITFFMAYDSNNFTVVFYDFSKP
jgi:hypothetical protein